MAKDIIAPHLIDGIVYALYEVFHNQAKSDRIIAQILKERRKWGSRDRKIFARSVYECSRWWRRLWYSLGFPGDSFKPDNITEEKVLSIWKLWLKIDRPDFYKNPQKPDSDQWKRWKNPPQRSIRESLSDWLDLLGQKELGSLWDEILPFLNIPAEAYLRTNSIKIDRPLLLKEITHQNIEAVEVKDDSLAICLKERKNVFVTDIFKRGFFEMQDIGSQKISPYLDALPGMRVVDACAGGGGKSLHLASLMNNKGKIIALDKNDWRLSPLRDRAARAGADIIESRVISSLKVIKRLYDSADRLLLDVPCSGSGVIRRSPDTKWTLTENQFQELLKTQEEILARYSPIVKKNGIMVYSTCSLFPSENQKQIEKFLSSEAGQNWQLLEHQVILPFVENSEPGKNFNMGHTKSIALEAGIKHRSSRMIINKPESGNNHVNGGGKTASPESGNNHDNDHTESNPPESGNNHDNDHTESNPPDSGNNHDNDRTESNPPESGNNHDNDRTESNPEDPEKNHGFFDRSGALAPPKILYLNSDGFYMAKLKKV